MSILIDRLPEHIMISGQPVPIYADFRTWILFEQLTLDSTVPRQEKVERLLRLTIRDPAAIPRKSQPQQISNGLLWFYRGGDRRQNEHQIREQQRAEAKKQAGEEPDARYYDYEFDADYIYSAFIQQYGIDLERANLHWWKFLALFSGLTDDTLFMKVVGYRGIRITKDMTDSQKNFYRKMKSVYALPLPQDELEKSKAIETALQSGDVAALMRLIGKSGGSG